MQIRLEQILDPEVVRQVLLVDDMYLNLVIGQDMDTWVPNLNTVAYFFLFRDENPMGLIALERFCSNGVIYHGAVFKSERGKGTTQVLREVFKIIKKMTDGKQITTVISTKNEKAIELNKKAGLVEKCIIPNASLDGDIMILSE